MGLSGFSSALDSVCDLNEVEVSGFFLFYPDLSFLSLPKKEKKLF